jgi:hypothetical protein
MQCKTEERSTPMKTRISVLMLVTLVIVVANVDAQVQGTGTPGHIPVWTDTATLGDSNLDEIFSTVEVDCSALGLQICLMGQNNGFPGVTPIGVAGESDNGRGVQGASVSGVGVRGNSTSGRGVEGQSDSVGGVVGISNTGDGVGGIVITPGVGAAIVGLGNGVSPAGDFEGNVLVDGDFIATGLKLFRIDHPLDPANRYLAHAAIESPEVLNLYSGTITTDATGIGVVDLPGYFSAINRDFRYQLTVIGQFAQAIVASEIAGNRFMIRTDKPSVKVSWQVTGVRQDAWAQAHPMEVEQDKGQFRGTYLHPELFGEPEEQGQVWLEHPDLMRDAKAMRERAPANRQKF